MNRVITLLLICLPLLMQAQVNIQWVSRYTSTGANIDKAQSLALDASGNVYVTGIGRGASGNFDYITIKYDNAGAQQWVATYNGPGNGYDEARSIAVDASGNVYVTGWSAGVGNNYDYATVMYDAAGAQQWASRYNGPANGFDEAYAVAVDASGNVYVTGGSDGSGTGSDFATIQYNSAGVQQWASRYTNTGANIDAGFAITLDASGNIYVTGYSFGTGADQDYATVKYNSAGAQQWVSRYNGTASNFDAATSLAVDGAGNVYVTGYSRGTAVTDFDYATVKYNSAGAQQWVMRYNGTAINEEDRANAIALDALGNVYVTGRSVGAATAQDIVTIKYNNAGSQQWAVRYSGAGSNYDEGNALAIDASGFIYVTGYSYTSSTNNDYTTIKYDASGNQQWLTKYNGPASQNDQAAAIAVDGSGNIYITGASRGVGSIEDYATIRYCQLTAMAGNDVAICLGASTQLNATGAVSYQWNTSAGLNDSTIANPVATPTVTTTYIVTATNTSGCVDKDTVVVTVYPLPGPAITAGGPTTFCQGDSVVLTSDPFDTYQWSTSDTTQSITVYTPGIYTVIVTDTNTCSAQSQVTVTVNPLPPADAGANIALCLSSTGQLNATGGVSFAWTPPAGLSDTSIANPQTAPVVSTTYTVYVTDANGCVNSDSVTVQINSNPPVPVVIQSFDTLSSTPAYGYQWYYNGNPITGATTQWIQPDSNGSYYVIVFDSLGCSTASSAVTVADVGINELDALQMNIYPNPNNGMFTVHAIASSAIELRLVNITGQVVYKEQLGTGEIHKQFDLSYAKGVYYLQLITGKGISVKKIVVN
jgi:uncharacterized delta-60 repeat protein